MNNRLKQIRDIKQETQIEFAKNINMSQKTYCNYELGERKLTGEFLKLLADVYNVNIHWLITGKGEMFWEETKSNQKIEGNQNALNNINNSTINIFREDNLRTEIIEDLQKIPETKIKKVYHLFKALIEDI